MSEPVEPTAADSPALGHEPTSLSGRSVFLWGMGLATLIGVGFAVTWGLWTWLRINEGQPVTPFEGLTAGSHPPGHTVADLDPHQRQTRLEFEQQQQELLTTYGWVNQPEQIARIPIERAMQIIVEEGTEQE